MSIRNLLGLPPRQGGVGPGETEIVRRITRELAAVEPDQARYLAAFAFILSRVARADAGISATETREMERTVAFWGALSPAQAVLVVEIAKAQSTVLAATDLEQVICQFKSLSLPVQRQELLHCLFAVSQADDAITGIEEALAREIASQLGLSEREYLDIRTSYLDRRTPQRGVPNAR
jgi:uncharacterized tellurite resistance protein B-like protein